MAEPDATTTAAAGVQPDPTWTLAALHAHLAATIDGEVRRLTGTHEADVARLDALIAAHLDAARRQTDQEQQRVEIALDAMKERLALLNEFRRQSADEQRRFAPRELVDALAERVAAIEKQMAADKGKSTGYAGVWAFVAASVGVIVGLAVIYSIVAGG